MLQQVPRSPEGPSHCVAFHGLFYFMNAWEPLSSIAETFLFLWMHGMFIYFLMLCTLGSASKLEYFHLNSVLYMIIIFYITIWNSLPFLYDLQSFIIRITVVIGIIFNSLYYCRYQPPIPADQVKPWTENDYEGGKTIILFNSYFLKSL